MFTVDILQRVAFHMKQRRARQGEQGGRQQWQRRGGCMQTAHRQAEHAKRQRKGRGRRKEATEREREKQRKREKEKERKRKRERVRERRSEGAKGDRVA